MVLQASLSQYDDALQDAEKVSCRFKENSSLILCLY